MNVSITKELEREVSELVKSGQYGSSSEVVRAGLRLLIERERRIRAEEEMLFEAARDGIAQLERGEGVIIPIRDIGKLAKRLAEEQGLIPRSEG